MELSKTQASGIESQSLTHFNASEVNYTCTSHTIDKRHLTRLATCGHCGNVYLHPQGQPFCPARGVECRSCGNLNNFARVCRSKPIQTSSSNRRPLVDPCLVQRPPTNPANFRPLRRIRHDSKQ